MESLKRSIDQFYHEATPLTCISTALPGLCTAMRTVESVSRYYARQGYLGLLFTKVTNQLVNVCKEYLSEMAANMENDEYFWPTIFNEIEEHHSSLNHQDSYELPVSESIFWKSIFFIFRINQIIIKK